MQVDEESSNSEFTVQPNRNILRSGPVASTTLRILREHTIKICRNAAGIRTVAVPLGLRCVGVLASAGRERGVMGSCIGDILIAPIPNAVKELIQRRRCGCSRSRSRETSENADKGPNSHESGYQNT